MEDNKKAEDIYEVTPRLLEILEERNITQLQLAKLTGVSQGAISRFDKNTQHRDVNLFAIAEVLGIKIEELFHVKKK